MNKKLNWLEFQVSIKNNHTNQSKIKADTTFLSPISNKDKHFINVMEGRLKEIITKPTKITDSKIEQLKEKLAKYAIQRKNNSRVERNVRYNNFYKRYGCNMRDSYVRNRL